MTRFGTLWEISTFLLQANCRKRLLEKGPKMVLQQ